MIPGFAALVAALALVFTPAPARGQGKQISSQTAQPGSTQDFSSAAITRPMRIGTTTPSTCRVGDQFYKTNASAGSNLYGCTATNTWTAQAGGTGGSGTVTSIATTGPISGGTITDTGTIACATCVTAASALTANLPMIGGGSQASAVGTRSGNTTAFVTTTGAQTSGRCVEIDASGNHIAGAAGCGPGGSGASISAVSFSATPTFDGGSGTVKTFTMTLTGNVTSCTLSNFTAGQVSTFALTQDGSGSHTFACAGISNLGTVSGIASKLDTQTFIAPTTSTLQALAPMWCVTCSPAIILPGSSSGATTLLATAAASGTLTLPATTANLAYTVASGTATLGTSAISSASCATVVTVSATGTLTTDVVTAGFNGDPTGVTGYVPLTTGGLTIFVYPSADNINVKACNSTVASITPGAITLNFRVGR